MHWDVWKSSQHTINIDTLTNPTILLLINNKTTQLYGTVQSQ